MINEIGHNCKSKGDCCGFCCTKIENFNVTIGKNNILEKVNVHIHCGELTAIIGPNGAGKTTLLKAILGEVDHTGALIYIDAKGARTGHPLIGYVPQHLDFDLGSPTSVFDIFMACRTSIPSWIFKPRSISASVAVSLAKVKAEHLLHRKLGTLSGGELQRVLLALALDPIPDLLLLDEPVAGIDHNGLELFYNIVSELRRNYDLSIILVSHDLDLVARYADRVVLMNKTMICSGSPREVFSDERTSKIFGMSWYKLGHEIKLPSANYEGDI